MVPINEIQEFFNNNPAPEKPVKLSQCEYINNAKRFVESHLAVLLANPKKPVFIPYYHRLLKIYHLCKETI